MTGAMPRQICGYGLSEKYREGERRRMEREGGHREGDRCLIGRARVG